MVVACIREVKKHICFALALPVLEWQTILGVESPFVKGECEAYMLDIALCRGDYDIDFIFSCSAALRSSYLQLFIREYGRPSFRYLEECVLDV